jgi:fatty acyl-CoA reductase
MERIRKEILNSYCFENVRKSHKDFNAFAESKIIPI